MSDDPNDRPQRPPDNQNPQNPSGPYQQPPYQQPPYQEWQQPPQGYQQPPTGYPPPPPGGYPTPPGNQAPNWQQPSNWQPQPQAQESSNSGVWGWVIFILIFGVGNLILYSTTGWFIIPIPRR
jgi:hypothetical protein